MKKILILIFFLSCILFVNAITPVRSPKLKNAVSPSDDSVTDDNNLNSDKNDELNTKWVNEDHLVKVYNLKGKKKTSWVVFLKDTRLNFNLQKYYFIKRRGFEVARNQATDYATFLEPVYLKNPEYFVKRFNEEGFKFLDKVQAGEEEIPEISPEELDDQLSKRLVPRTRGKSKKNIEEQMADALPEEKRKRVHSPIKELNNEQEKEQSNPEQELEKLDDLDQEFIDLFHPDKYQSPEKESKRNNLDLNEENFDDFENELLEYIKDNDFGDFNDNDLDNLKDSDHNGSRKYIPVGA